MKTFQYRAEVAERYIKYLHSNTFPPHARKRGGKFTRLAINNIPFWNSIDFRALLKEIRQDDSDLFVNISLQPNEYQTYLSRVVPYAEKIVLADPIPTLYEWRDRSVVNDEEFDALIDQVLNTLLPLYPLSFTLKWIQRVLGNLNLPKSLYKVNFQSTSRHCLVANQSLVRTQKAAPHSSIVRWVN